MPEGIEIEIYRRAAEAVVDRVIESVDADDEWFCKGDTTPELLHAALPGRRIVAADRIGKLLLLDLDGDDPDDDDPDGDDPDEGVRLGLRFGMTGRLLVDGGGPIDTLEYSSDRDDPAWDRFGLRFVGGGSLTIRDPRRLGGVELDPDVDALGDDLFGVTLGQLRRRVLVGDVSLKARLLDQARLAGVGNLIADETLWRAGLDPARPAGSLTDAEARRLQRHLRQVADDLLASGGSHTGRLQSARVRGATCPRDGAPLERRTIGGRTTYSCPQHQR